MADLTKQLAKIQATLNAPKNQRNNFGKYNYRSCEDILQAVKPLLGELVILVSDEVIQVGDRIYIKATASIGDGQHLIECHGWAREALSRKGMDDSQITGSASSYARKYALNGLLLIDDNKDADTQDNSQPAKPAPTAADYSQSIKNAKSLDALKNAWLKVPKNLQGELTALKDLQKEELLK